ncbi:MAG: cysteine desulfurase family protein [Planctomycetota bacterium]|nr:cysteine desulfurase family protein [Planctomycetota bacterium]
MQQIYLDNNATTTMLPEVAEVINEAHRAGYVNPASQHQSGQRARRVLEDARERITQLLGGETTGLKPDRFILTSGGTESNNLALRGLAAGGRDANIVISPIEHPSISETAQQLARGGVEVRRLPVDSDGVVQADALSEFLDERTRVVSVMLANHETGVLQPVEEIACLARERGILVHSDGVQAVGKIRVDFRALGVDALSVAAHKLHGPVGIGGLLVRHDVTPAPMMAGGFQQQGLRPGTEPVALTLGFLTALEMWAEHAAEHERRMRSLRDLLEARLRAEISSLIINGCGAKRLPHTSNVSFPGLNRQAVVLALDMAGVACSTGSACASGSSEPSPVLIAMGLAEPVIEGSIRSSLSRLTTAADIELASQRILGVYKTLEHN